MIEGPGLCTELSGLAKAFADTKVTSPDSIAELCISAVQSDLLHVLIGIFQGLGFASPTQR